jgi:hypothetical protein
MVDHEFRFFRLDVVLGDLATIPLDPPEFVRHARTSLRH